METIKKLQVIGPSEETSWMFEVGAEAVSSGGLKRLGIVTKIVHTPKIDHYFHVWAGEKKIARVSDNCPHVVVLE